LGSGQSEHERTGKGIWRRTSGGRRQDFRQYRSYSICDSANTVIHPNVINSEIAEPKEKPQKLGDSNGLQLYVPAALARAHACASRTLR